MFYLIMTIINLILSLIFLITMDKEMAIFFLIVGCYHSIMGELRGKK